MVYRESITLGQDGPVRSRLPHDRCAGGSPGINAVNRNYCPIASVISKGLAESL
jgi:hypothetical protein